MSQLQRGEPDCQHMPLDHSHPQLHHTQLSTAPRSQQREKLLYNSEACHCLTEHTKATKIAADFMLLLVISSRHLFISPSFSTCPLAFFFFCFGTCILLPYAGNLCFCMLQCGRKQLVGTGRRLIIAMINTIALLHTGHRGQLCLPCTWQRRGCLMLLERERLAPQGLASPAPKLSFSWQDRPHIA